MNPPPVTRTASGRPAPGEFYHVTRTALGFDRCPKAWLRDEAQDELALISDWRWLRDYRVLPLAGGKLDQDPRFLEAVDELRDAAASLAETQRRLDGPAGAAK